MRDIRSLRDRKDAIKEELKQIEEQLRKKQAVVLATYDARGIHQMKVVGAGTFYVQEKIYPSPIDKPGFIKWLDEHGIPELAPRTVNHMTLVSWFSERTARGGELPPPSLVATHVDRQIRVRKK